MEYSHSDTELIRQPIGYWSWAASHAVVTRIRGALAELGISQPQWWVLNQVAPAPDGRSRGEVTEMLKGYLEVDGALEEEIDTTVARGWITQDADATLRITPEGSALYAKAAALQERLWTERHEGITDEEYLITLKVLQRFIHNTGGHAWHH
ncbi:MarR family winged helix-turn-helix transcriptional regulator [Streptomyces purpurogeneiscleroticus]|uniref:MarR family winged helix-turn-helix transcriptional regulator n=1 Tax=Streptomyces purpurogeneiscleroticus TaxID=68259 RepID=UPI001CBE1709|nr:MarR family winged helix-turn-helix transcriptional regulator [Streptomyces purpurogeneiscleroticus]MBZ4019123.1 transcriptional regulator [Streptomyces purpurogeneiscleroticus]